MAREIKTEFVADDVIRQLIVLTVLEKIEIAVTDISLMEICFTVASPWIEYIDFNNSLERLVKYNFVKKIGAENKSGELRYKITESGIDCLGYFYNKIPKSIRDNISQFCNENKTKFKAIQEYIPKYEKNIDNTYTAIFKIVSPDEEKNILELRINYASRELAITACEKWVEKAADIYGYIFDTLGE